MEAQEKKKVLNARIVEERRESKAQGFQKARAVNWVEREREGEVVGYNLQSPAQAHSLPQPERARAI